jgi:uncharacterized protein (DUF697 family)
MGIMDIIMVDMAKEKAATLVKEMAAVAVGVVEVDVVVEVVVAEEVEEAVTRLEILYFLNE